MRRARPRRWLLPGVLLAALVAGCGGGPKQSQPVTFETLPDTAGLSHGLPVVDSLQVVRMDGGALRVFGRVNLPEGTRLQVAVRPRGGGSSVAMTQALVSDGRFETVPIAGDMGPLPPGIYRFELLAYFTPEWQTAAVLRATDDGRTLRGPGITRTKQGEAAFRLEEELER